MRRGSWNSTALMAIRVPVVQVRPSPRPGETALAKPAECPPCLVVTLTSRPFVIFGPKNVWHEQKLLAANESFLGRLSRERSRRYVVVER
jgi:hypothetical protein